MVPSHLGIGIFGHAYHRSMHRPMRPLGHSKGAEVSHGSLGATQGYFLGSRKTSREAGHVVASQFLLIHWLVLELLTSWGKHVQNVFFFPPPSRGLLGGFCFGDKHPISTPRWHPPGDCLPRLRAQLLPRRELSEAHEDLLLECWACCKTCRASKTYQRPCPSSDKIPSTDQFT